MGLAWSRPKTPARRPPAAVTPDHLLLGCSRPAALATALLQQQEIDITQPSAARRSQLPRQSPSRDPFQRPRRWVLELTFPRKRFEAGPNYIGTEHLLLALLELRTGMGRCIDPASQEPRREPT